MNLSIVGSGYVGTTIAACLADLGHSVMNVDIDTDIVEAINAGKSPIHEPGLDDLVSEHGGDRLTATTDYGTIKETDVTFLALPTPSEEDGSIALSIITDGARTLGEVLASKENEHLVVVKSTVTPGTTEEVLGPTIMEAAGREVNLAMNPEFLREGSAVRDFLRPDKIVLGARTLAAHDRLRRVFAPLLDRNDTTLIETGVREAEMIKYANNAVLAAKVSLINELGNICKEYGVDTYAVADAIGLDSRIERSFLDSGLGWGGSCFPKDVAALVAAGRAVGYEPSLLESVVEVNDKQPRRMLELLREQVDPDGKRIAVLGLSFKAGTDDVRNSRAIPIIEGLLESGAEVVTYDPVATDQMRERFPELEYVDSASRALAGSYGALIVTDWDEFSTLDEEFGRMASPVVVDGRHVLKDSSSVNYHGLTW